MAHSAARFTPVILGPMFAVATLALVPIVVFFLLFQRLIVEGLSTAGIK